MAKYRNKRLAELALQLSYTPKKRKLEQIPRIRELALSVERGKQYPYEFVCYQITRFRPDDAPHEVFDGTSLLADLITLIHELSDSLDLTAEGAGQPVLTLEEVRRTYDVSLKTIRRWRHQGLVAMRFIFPDGRKRTGVQQSDLEAFVEAHSETIRRTASYQHIDAEARRAIVARAFELSLSDGLALGAVAGRIAREFTCPHDAVRELLEQYDRDHPDTPVFARAPQPLTDEDRRQILSLYRSGHQPGELAHKFLVARSTVARLVQDLTAEEILGRQWDYVFSPAFDEPGAEAAFLADLSAEELAERGMAGPLPADQEQFLFRQYNFLKYQLAKARDELRPSELTAEQLERVVRLHDAAVAVRNCLVVANLRLVVHLASRHVAPGRPLDGLVSDGTVSLMQAIERFDFNRGFRLSTYASWAILKNFAKTIPREVQARRAAMTGAQEIIDATAHKPGASPARRELREVLHSLVASMLLELSEREREVVIARFGLEGGAAETLEQIGRRLRVTRERVRQIEARALRKLAVLADPALVEDLAAPPSPPR